ncbi:MAG: hypothetical protein CL752_07885 [Chloroflexi bacterium]|nr:hypothetical protein [Chloroflexota bacterium]MCH2523909.1 hypothetical protein [Dehalococcoidia bacterium]
MLFGAHAIVKLIIMFGTIGLIAASARYFRISLSVDGVSWRIARFWLIMAAYSVPLGIVNLILFKDSLLFRASILIIIAAVIMFVLERVSSRK